MLIERGFTVQIDGEGDIRVARPEGCTCGMELGGNTHGDGAGGVAYIILQRTEDCPTHSEDYDEDGDYLHPEPDSEPQTWVPLASRSPNAHLDLPIEDE